LFSPGDVAGMRHGACACACVSVGRYDPVCTFDRHDRDAARHPAACDEQKYLLLL